MIQHDGTYAQFQHPNIPQIGQNPSGKVLLRRLAGWIVPRCGVLGGFSAKIPDRLLGFGLAGG
jgi:hypothetical protein